MEGPTKKQGKVLQAFREIESKKEWPATVQEVADRVGLKPATVRYSAMVLMMKGVLWKMPYYPHQFTVKERK